MVRALRKTSPQEVRLTIEDLVLLDKEWAKSDQFHGTELIDGRIYHTPARYARRVRAVAWLYEALRDALELLPGAPDLLTRVSIAMPPHDLPLPDIVLFAGYDGPHFLPRECVRLVIEVAESAASFFTGKKLRLYARHGVPEYWVVDLARREIGQFWGPAGEGYGQRRDVPFGEPIGAATIAGVVVETEGLV